VSRVLLVGKGAPDVGGIPTFLAMLQSGDLADEHEITFLNVAHAGVPEAGRWTMGNVTRTWRDTSSVWRMAKQNDVVHIHSALTPAVTVLRASLMAAAGRARGCGVVVHAHGGNLQMWLRDAKSRWILKVAMLPVSRVVPVWSAGAEALADVLGTDRVTLVDNGVDTDEFHPLDGPANDVPLVLYVGLLTPRKGVIDLIEASQLLTERGVAHRLALVGGTPDEGPGAEVEVTTAADGVAELRGRFPSSKMPAVYAEADVFCLPSWWEAMPLSVLEAMSCGLPVVASDVGDISRAIVDQNTGYVVPAKSPAKLADTLERLLTDRELRTRMGQEGRRRVVEKFSQKVMARNISAIFAEVTKARR
jgi:glycosyltransferase involved in cell wall biosynthesis